MYRLAGDSRAVGRRYYAYSRIALVNLTDCRVLNEADQFLTLATAALALPCVGGLRALSRLYRRMTYHRHSGSPCRILESAR